MAHVGKKAGMIAGIAIAALALAAGIALAVYVDNNRHGEERDLARAHAAGFEEKQVQVSIAIAGDATLNYAEGPDNGPALVLVHGQGRRSRPSPRRRWAARTSFRDTRRAASWPRGSPPTMSST